MVDSIAAKSRQRVKGGDPSRIPDLESNNHSIHVFLEVFPEVDM
jgi:hypothetical protein